MLNVVTLGDEEWLWYKPYKVDVALLRGTSADEKGNISIEREALSLEILSMAQAVKNAGGIVIVQVERIVSNGTIKPMNVKIPGIIVDYIVVADSDKHMQTFAEQYNPAFSAKYESRYRKSSRWNWMRAK